MKPVKIIVRNHKTTIEFAAAELLKYLQIMQDDENCAVIANDTEDTFGIVLGLFDNFGISGTGLKDPAFDDSFIISIKDGKGNIAGSNPRSVLFGVYRFLEENGCRWLRPGKNGDYVPKKNILDLSAEMEESASYRHRGMCIEGSVSVENMLDSIDWCAKSCMNTYMLEWENPYEYFNKWYGHKTNPFRTEEPRTLAETMAYKTASWVEIKKRGFTYHDMGHGWTGKALGLPTDLVTPWDRFFDGIDEKIKEKMDKYFALVDGRRIIQHNSPLNSNLCYGNQYVRDKIAADMLAYCKANPQVDVLHLWLGDSWNVQCECALCVDTTPSDFMIMICNDLDELLEKAGISTKIAFISYVDTIWPPQREKIRNEDRFMLLFAPISRTYSESYDTGTDDVELAPYVRNKLPKPRNVKENIGYLKKWFGSFEGDALCFEYHFWKDDYNDPAYYNIGKILSADIKNLACLKLNGIIEDQTQRAYFPTSFPMVLYAKTLWNRDLSFEEIAGEYFSAAFGADGNICRKYIQKLSDLFDPVYLRGDKGDPQNDEAARNLKAIPEVINGFLPVIEKNMNDENKSLSLSWRYLFYHAELCILLAKALSARAEGKSSIAREYWDLTYRFAYSHEDFLQPVFDVNDFVRFTGILFK